MLPVTHMHGLKTGADGVHGTGICIHMRLVEDSQCCCGGERCICHMRCVS